MKQKAREFLLDVLYDGAGGAVFAIGLGCFVGPAQIAPGGVSGLSIIINYLTGLPVGSLNITLKTLRSVFIQSVMIDLVGLWLPVYAGDRIMSALFGGVAIGVGLAPVFMRGSTTGGTDIVSRLIQLRFRHVSIGKLLFMVDTAVLLLSVAVFRNIETGLYGMITIYTSNRILDGILYGLDTGKVVLVISEKNQQIAQQVMDRLERGATFLQAEGAWSGQEKKVLLCVVRAVQCYRVEEIVRAADPDAFLVVMEANQIAGEGFRPITSDKVT